MFGRSKRKSKAEAGKVIRRSSNVKQQHRVVSYYTASRRQLDTFQRFDDSSNNKRVTKSSIFLKKWWFWLIVGPIMIAMGLYLLTLGNDPIVKIEGQIYRGTTEYQEIIKKELNNSWQNNFKTTIKSNELERALYDLLPEAITIKIGSSWLGHSPVVKIKTYEPLAVFSQNGQNNRIISNRGKILSTTDKSPGIDVNNLPLLQNDSGIEAQEGDQFMSPDDALAFSGLINQYKNEKAVVIYNLTTMPHEILALESGRGYKVKYLLNDQIVLQFGALRATEKKLAELGQVPSSYIDVRLADKVYYK